MEIDEVKQLCFKAIKAIVPDTEYNESTKGWIDDLDFIEIIMEVELEFDCKISEGETTSSDFNNVSDLIDWLAKKVV